MPEQSSGDYAEYQIEVPPSFVALYSDERHRLLVPVEKLRLRYEICEDLAQHLCGPAQSMTSLNPNAPAPDSQGIGIQRRILKGLLSGESGIDSREACWVMRRLAEMLDWPELDADEIKACERDE